MRQGLQGLQGLQVSSLGEEALRQPKDVLEISEGDAIRRRRREILGAVKFREIDDRYNGVSEAHQRTLGWIFDEQGPGCAASVVTYSDHQHGMKNGYGYNSQIRLEARHEFANGSKQTRNCT